MTDCQFTLSGGDVFRVYEKGDGIEILIERKQDGAATWGKPTDPNERSLTVKLTNVSIPGVIGPGVVFDLNQLRDKQINKARKDPYGVSALDLLQR